MTNRRMTSNSALADELSQMDTAQLLLLGICHQIRRTLGRVEKYRALVEDELETCGGNTTYLEKMCGRFATLEQLVSTAARHSCPKVEDMEPLRLHAVVRGVSERIYIESHSSISLKVTVPNEVMISGDAFLLQKMLLELSRHLMAGRSESYEIKAQVLTVDENEQMGSAWQNALNDECSDTRFVQVMIAPEGTPFPSLRELHAFGEMTDEMTTEALLQNARWLGEARMNGALYFTSELTEAPNAVLMIPLCAEDDDAAEADNSFQDEMAGMHRIPEKERTILLVDDEDMIWDVISDMLQTLGYQVILAGDGQEAVDICAANPGKIDLVILDMLMPNMNGREAFFLLREADPDIKVLISSGYVSQEEIQDVMDAGAVGFLRKPYRMKDLDKKIREILA